MKIFPLGFFISALLLLCGEAVRASFLIDPAGGTVLWSDAATTDEGVMRGRSLGFAFPYLDGDERTTIDVSVNGNLNAAGDTSYINEASPGAVARISPLWDDLVVLAGSGDSISEKRLTNVYAVTWRVHESGLHAATRHGFQVALFGGPVRLNGMDFAAGDIVFSYESIGETFGKDSATVGLDFGDESTVVAVPGASEETALLSHAAAVSLPAGPGGFILFRPDESGEYVASVHVNRPPAPQDDVRYLSSKGAVNIDVLANDLDPDGNPLTIVATTHGRVGTVTKNDDGTLRYLPGENFAGTDDFTYTVQDLFGLTQTARVSILPFSAGKGVFDGLITDLPGEDEEEATFTADGVGYLRLTLAANGRFTGTLVYGNAKLKLRGAFDSAGNYVGSFFRTVEDELRGVTLALHLDLTDAANPISGTIGDGEGASAISAARGRYDARRFPAPQAGKYTAQILPDEEASGPAGIGYVLFTVGRAGDVKLSGRLSDGRAWSFGTKLRTDGTFPLHVLLPVKRAPAGSLSGLARFDETSLTEDLAAPLHWFMPDTDLVSGFEAAPRLVAARYQAPPPGTCVLPLEPKMGNATIDVGPGELVETATITAKNKVSIAGVGASLLRISITASRGLFAGTMAEETLDDPPRILRRKISGAFVTKQKTGGGFYLTSDGTSVPVAITPPVVEAAR